MTLKCGLTEFSKSIGTVDLSRASDATESIENSKSRVDRDPICIGLLGMYASRNLGDVAIQLAVMRALHARCTNIKFVGLCQDPEDTVRTFGISAIASSGRGRLITPTSLHEAENEVPMGMPSIISKLFGHFNALRQIWRQARLLDMLLISGSGQIDDFWGGPWAQPFRLLAWSLAARLQGKPVAVFGVGVDELHSSLGKWFCLRALSCAEICVVRDAGSRDALRAMGFSSPIEVCADPAFHLSVEAFERSGDTGSPYAVISPISRRAWPGAEDESYEKYLSALARVAEYLQEQSVQVRFVCSQIRMDPPIVDRIIRRMRKGTAVPSFLPVTTVDEYLSAVEGAQLIVGSRLHALILALVVGTPAIAVSGVRKVHQLFADIGFSDHAFDIRSLNVPALLTCIENVVSSPEKMRMQVRETTREFKSQLEVQFDRLSDIIHRTRANE